MRFSKQRLEKEKLKHGVDELFSWSKYHTGKTDPYGYYLKYIKHEPETRHSIYGVSGGNAHDILEKYYTKILEYKDMIKEWEMKKYEMELADLKFNRNDEKKNEIIANKYLGNMDLFFIEHVPVEGKVICEQGVFIRVGKYLFQGYIDFLHKENNKYIITDFKTSTMYVGKKVLEERGQLVLYAESLIQLGIPIEDIIIRWNFLKYTKVEIRTLTKDKETKSEKIKTKKCLRTTWVEEISKDLTKLMQKLTDYDETEIVDMVQTACENNNLNNLPEEIQNRISKGDCYVEIPLDQAAIDDLKEDIIHTLDDLKEKEKEYEETKDDTLFWTQIDKSNEYFFNNLCGYSGKQHKPYGEYLDTLNMLVRDKNKEDKKTNCDEDLSWLDDLD